jgi:hypothetical protein
VNLASFMAPPPLFVEIGHAWLKARHGDNGAELPLERGADGRITVAGREKIIAALKDLLKAKSWQPRARAWCAISSRGISLRRFSLPGGSGQEFHQRLLLQIEAEFPLPPEDLAWGWQSLTHTPPSNGAAARQDLLVAAVKKEWLADYHEILRACGTEPVFTLAALARWNFCGQPAGSFAMLDSGGGQSELTFFEKGVPTASRIIFGNGKNGSGPGASPVETLAQNLNCSLAGARVFVSGDGVSKDFTEQLARTLGQGCECRRLEFTPAPGGSTAIAGLEKFAMQAGTPPLAIRLEQTGGGAANFADLDWKKWRVRVGALAAIALLLPYAEALLLKPHLARKVAEFQTESARLTVIDRELEFLRGLKQSQPPYLDLLYVFSKSAPPGTHFDSLSLNSHGDVSLRTAFHDGQSVADFRNQLVASGFFTNVVVEEQTPTPDHQRVNVRMTAQEMPAALLQMQSARLAMEDAAKDKKTAPPDPAPGATSAPPVMGKATP